MGESIDVWRMFFRTTAGTDVFEFIDKAIAIAALDRPEDFMSRRDRIAERLFSCETTAGAGGDRSLASKESKANGDVGNAANDVVKVKFSQGEAETFRDDVEETSRVVGEVLRIKRVLDNSRHESDSALHESLRRLRSMNIPVDILERTRIGASVNGLRRNCLSKQIAQLAHNITMGWKAMVEEIGRCAEDVANPRDAGDGKTSSIVKPNLSSNTNSRTTPASAFASRKFEKERMPQPRDSNGSVARHKRPLANQQDNIKGWADVKLQPAKGKMQGHNSIIPSRQTRGGGRCRYRIRLIPQRRQQVTRLRAPQLQKPAGRGGAISRSHNCKSLLERLRSRESSLAEERYKTAGC